MLPRRPFAAVLLASLISPLLAQNGDRAGEVQAQPPAHLKVPPAPALPVEEALKTHPSVADALIICRFVQFGAAMLLGAIKGGKNPPSA